MPKADPCAHFDVHALLVAVHQQDIGIRITTNNPDRFKQLVYREARKAGLPIHIHSDPRAQKSFFLMGKDLAA